MELHELEFDKAFIPVTADLQAGIELVFERGEREMKKRHKLTCLLSLVAALALVFGAAGFAISEINEPKPDYVVLNGMYSTVTPAAEAALPAAEAARRMVFEPDFDLVDPSEENALQTLLDMAWRDYCELEGIEHDSLWVDEFVLHTLRAIPGKYGAAEEKWIEPVRVVLKGYLGFDLNYIQKYDLVNRVIACLSAGQTSASQENAAYDYELSGMQLWNENLEIYLTEAYLLHCGERELQPQAGALYRAAGELVEIPLRYGGDPEQWYSPIADCLQSTLGMEPEAIRQWDLVAGISGYLEADVVYEAPEKKAG